MRKITFVPGFNAPRLHLVANDFIYLAIHIGLKFNNKRVVDYKKHQEFPRKIRPR